MEVGRFVPDLFADRSWLTSGAGVAFFALLTFPTTTPSVQPTSNPFDAPIQSSPFPSLPSADTDLCLSLESMRGRKYLQVRGIVDLSDGEVLDGEDVGVQMSVVRMVQELELIARWYRSISPDAPLVAAYFTTLLCRSETLSSQGRTLIAILIGLGDEGVGKIATMRSCHSLIEICRLDPFLYPACLWSKIAA